MKQLFAVLAMMLVLVFALADNSHAGVYRGEDYDNIGDFGGDGGEDGDHPWGGDRVIGGGGDKTARTSVVTGNIGLDLLLGQFLQYFTTTSGSTTGSVRTNTYRARLLSEKRERSYAIASERRFDSSPRKVEQR
jgi:hypothetical protein